jgi:ADP-ribosylglycohydrolase
MNDPKILDKAEGALIGSALGDAIGIYTGKPRSLQFINSRDLSDS